MMVYAKNRAGETHYDKLPSINKAAIWSARNHLTITHVELEHKFPVGFHGHCNLKIKMMFDQINYPVIHVLDLGGRGELSLTNAISRTLQDHIMAFMIGSDLGNAILVPGCRWVLYHPDSVVSEFRDGKFGPAPAELVDVEFHEWIVNAWGMRYDHL